MNMKKRCFGCMEMKTNSPVCERCGYDERQENASHQLPVGTILRGQYLIGKVLGQGGFGITYLGWDRNLDIPVAIKEFFPGGAVARDNSYNNTVQCFSTIQCAYGESKGRFLREAKTLAKFRDIPEIVSVQGFFEENNTAYIVMEYVKGTDLRRHIRNRGGRLSLAETLAVMKPVMEALAKVHENGVIHRDISPDNIMLLPNGRVKLLDFGAVRELHNPNAEGILTHSTEAILKRGFAPAEQYQRRGSLGPWTDIYALCATIYCCLTGKVPPESQELLMDGDRIHWETVPGLNRRQMENLTKATALLPKDRTASVKELYQGLYISEQQPPIHRQQPLVTAPVQNPRPVTFEGTGPVDRTVQKNEWQAKAAHQPNPQPKSTGKKHKRTAVIAAVLAVAVGAGMFFGGGKEKANELPEVTGGITTQWETPENNILMENPVREENGDLSLEAEGQEQAFNTEAKRNEIRSITFFDDLSQVPKTAADASKMQNGKVKAWAVKNEDLYDLYIAAKGGVRAPEDASFLFAGMTEVKKITFADAFFTDSTQSMAYLFADCRKLETVDIGCFDTGAVTDMTHMFSGCDSLAVLDVSGFDTANVRDMSYMFAGCKSLEALDLTHFVISDATDLTSMFHECPVPVPAWYRFAIAQDNILMENPVQEVDGEVNLEAEKTEPTFHTKAKRQEVKTITFLSDLAQAPEDAVDASQNQDGKVLAWVEKSGNLYDLYLAAEGGIFAPADAGYLFVNMTQLTQINFNDAFYTDDTIDMNQMFMGCEKLESLDVSGFNTSSAENMKSMFNGCAMLKKLDVSGFDTSRVTNMSYMFRSCTCLQELDLSGFDTGNVQNMRLMFDGCTSMVSLDVSGFDTSAVTDMYAMFSECTSLLSLDLSGFDTGNVTDMSFMFSECLSLTSLDISGFDTSNVTEMDAMFQMCEVLTVLDVSSFNTSKVTVMDYMFSKCKKVEKLDVSGFDTSNVTNMDHMFARCESLRELDLSNFDISKVTDKSWMFHGCPAPKPSWA